MAWATRLLLCKDCRRGGEAPVERLTPGGRMPPSLAGWKAAATLNFALALLLCIGEYARP